MSNFPHPYGNLANQYAGKPSDDWHALKKGTPVTLVHVPSGATYTAKFEEFKFGWDAFVFEVTVEFTPPANAALLPRKPGDELFVFQESVAEGTWTLIADASSGQCFNHDWKPYVGFTEVYDYCARCDAKRTPHP